MELQHLCMVLNFTHTLFAFVAEMVKCISNNVTRLVHKVLIWM